MLPLLWPCRNWKHCTMQSSLRLPHSASQVRLRELVMISLARRLLRGDIFIQKAFCQPLPQSSQEQAAVLSAVPKPPMFPSLPSLNTSSIHCLTCIYATLLCFQIHSPRAMADTPLCPRAGGMAARGNGAPRPCRAAGRRRWKAAAGCPPQRGRRASSRSGCFL